ncbi:hypothetical protein ANCDUO_02181 [Ancylostoma duodenale]|uniref:Uncharacterized protein n=1 Tax=Ancylostoma duodenale TaxID=51022 RepID=A0A0C2DCB7_9BILA|nr:hypothetical protein ANCDUO_02181 [Ancylostoma duodenale]
MPNRVVYEDMLARITAFVTSMLVYVMEFPAPWIPFMFINVIDICIHLIELLKGGGISPEHICVITFEQFQRVEQAVLDQRIEVSTADSILGREKETPFY